MLYFDFLRSLVWQDRQDSTAALLEAVSIAKSGIEMERDATRQECELLKATLADTEAARAELDEDMYKLFAASLALCFVQIVVFAIFFFLFL